MYTKLNLGLVSRFSSNWSRSLLLATKLDPRFKNMPGFSVSDQNSAQRLLRDEYTRYKPSNIETKQPESLLSIICAPIENEFLSYESIGPLPITACPLQWWHSHQSLFPTLSQLARQYLGVMATSVPSENLFSKAGEIVTKKRSRLGTKTVGVIAFLNGNQSIMVQF